MTVSKIEGQVREDSEVGQAQDVGEEGQKLSSHVTQNSKSRTSYTLPPIDPPKTSADALAITD